MKLTFLSPIAPMKIIFLNSKQEGQKEKEK